MKVAVIGAGAMGGALAAEAARAGHDVTVVDVAPDLVAHIRTHGITVDDADSSVTVPVAATTDPAEAGPADVAIVFVKAPHTAGAAASLVPLIGPDTAIATLQNGWGNADVLAGHLPADRLVIGVTYQSCTTIGDGHVLHSGRGPTTVGPYEPDGDLGRARKVAGLLDDAGWTAEATAGVRTEIWKKLVLNAATLPTAALAGLPPGPSAGPLPCSTSWTRSPRRRSPSPGRSGWRSTRPNASSGSTRSSMVPAKARRRCCRTWRPAAPPRSKP